METDRIQRYVASLEQVIRNTHSDLKETMAQFQEYSQWFAVERTVPITIATDMRKAYKDMHDRMSKIRGIDQLLQGRYRQYYRRDPVRDREMSEMAALSKNLYSRFESMLEEIEEKGGEKGEGEREMFNRSLPYQWFRSAENQVILMNNLRGLYDLDYIYKAGAGSDFVRKPRITQNEARSLSLFSLSGQGGVIDLVQFRMRLREYDIKERYAQDELRGVLTHLRRISMQEVEDIVRRFIGNAQGPKLKCLLLSLQSEESLRHQSLLSSARDVLKGMQTGEVRTLQA
jgi:hypothetical protein